MVLSAGLAGASGRGDRFFKGQGKRIGGADGAEGNLFSGVKRAILPRLRIMKLNGLRLRGRHGVLGTTGALLL